MSTDDLTESEEEAWVSEQREKVTAYLESQKCQHGGVGEWPAFHVVPYFALWAIQSKKHEGRIGWWAVSGDIPTDYMSSADGYHPREAIKHFSRVWAEAADYMRRGIDHPEMKVGYPENREKLAPLLIARSNILKDWSEDDTLWQE